MRDGFHEIVSGWTIIDDFDDLTERIERAAEWTKANGPLEPDEQATVKLMIEAQVARGIRRGDFEPYIPSDTELGPTGEYPLGSLGPHDKGELRAALSRNSRGDVQIDFGTNVSWVCLPPEAAINLARAIAKMAGAKRVEIEL